MRAQPLSLGFWKTISILIWMLVYIHKNSVSSTLKISALYVGDAPINENEKSGTYLAI